MKSKDTIFELDLSAPKVPRFVLTFKDPEHEKAEADGKVRLRWDTLELVNLLMQSDLMEPMIADKDFTDTLIDNKGKKIKRKYKKGDWVFDLQGERKMQFRANNKALSIQERAKIIKEFVDLGRTLFGLDEVLVTQDQVLDVWNGFNFHCEKHSKSVNKILEKHDRKLAQKKSF